VVGAAVAAGTLVVELWLEAVDDVALELVVAFSAVLEELDDDLPAYEAAAT
jgi:hypothetical protein